ncbi:MAG: right-handed parallel beta-helix repeat-containing protein [Verrucomicrobia bacterium]|nr:right-handed parallel beta-helix repeat-containing protein [Verrucomicrobiota bacterium]
MQGQEGTLNLRAALALVTSALVFTVRVGSGIEPAPVTDRDKMQTDEQMGTREAGTKPAAVELAPGDDIQKALDQAEPGDTIVLMDGVYYQSLLIARGGTPGKPVTLRAAHGGGAVLSGAVPPDQAKLTFDRVEGNLYKAAVPHRVWWAMVGPRNLVNYGTLDLLKQFRFPDQSNGDLNPSIPEGFAWQDGALYIRLENEADPNAEPVEISRLTGGEVDPELGKIGHKGGHWAPDTGFDVPGLGHLFSWTLGLVTVKADNVVIEGLRLHMGVGAAVIVHGNDVTIRDCYITGSHLGICQPDSVALPPHKTPGERPINRGNRTGRGLTVEYCEFTAPPGYEAARHGGWGGLYGANISAVFMNYGGARSVVRHNWIYDSSQDHLQPRGNGTSAPEDAGEIAYNFLQNCGDDSIEFDSSTPMNLRVHHNVIMDALCLLSLCPVMGGGLTIDHNLFYDSPENSIPGCPWLKLGTPWGKGLPTRDVRLIHNTVVQPRGCLQWFGSDQRYEDILMENNIIYVGEAQVWDSADFPISRHNLYCGPRVKAEHMPQMTHAKQPFASLRPIDFGIRPDSVAVDAGASGKDEEYFHKSAGEAPDLGAIELGEEWHFPRPGPRWATGSEIAGRPALPASFRGKWVGME